MKPMNVDGPTNDGSSRRTATPVSVEGRAITSFGWAAASFGINRFLLFVATLVLARVLAPSDFGLVAAGMTLITYFEIGLDLGVGSALIYEQEKGITARVQTAFTLNMLVSAAFTVVGIAAAPAVARLFHVPDEAAIFRMLFVYLLIRGAGQIPDAILKRDLSFKKRMLVDVLRAVVRAAVSIGLALVDYGAWAIVWGILAGEIAGTVMSWSLVRFVPRFSIDRSAGATLLRFGLSFVALKALAEVGMNSDYLVVGNRLGPTQLGFYTMSYRLPELLIDNVYWIFSSVAFPVYSQARTLGGDAFRVAMLRALRLMTLFGFSLGIGLALTARDAIHVLFSSKWDPAAGPMTLIALAAGLAAVGYASGDIFPAIGKPGTLLKINAPLALALLVAFVLAAPYGIIAVAAVHLGFQLCYGALRLVVANRIVGSTLRESVVALRPAVIVSSGILVCGLPVRLMTDVGSGSLLAITLAGAAGGVAGLMIGARPEIGELRTIAARMLGRA